MSLVDTLTRAELAWLATLNPEPLTAGEFVAHAWARQQAFEVARRAKAARAFERPGIPRCGQFLTRDMAIETRRNAAGPGRAGNKYLVRAP